MPHIYPPTVHITPDTSLEVAVQSCVQNLFPRQVVIREIDVGPPALPAVVVQRPNVCIAITAVATVAIGFEHPVTCRVFPEARVNAHRE
ncbi:hypothetical protein SDC9_114965 [bioreactor metagenome]|uniref:Uncharacterized protein n=1 Tax=bioreactor metagenome TaxID=1076179 RepID=A0A645BRI6_9ZZZZ